MSSFPVIAYTLTDLSILNSDLGRLAIHVAMVADLFHSATHFGVPVRESLLLGLITNFKGIVEVTVLNIWMDARGSQNYYAENTIMVLGTVVAPAVVTPLVKYLYDPSMKYLTYKRRSILQSKQKESDFRVLVCRASPLLIAHPRHKPLSSSNTTRSDRIINAFQQFESRHHNLVTVQTFSTISPYASMHNDICSMSVDKRTSLIIFPFRRQDTIVFVPVIRFYGVTSSSSDRVITDDDNHFRINSMQSGTSTYKEIGMKDGSETIWAIRSFHGDFDLMLVGRQQITDSNLINGRFYIDDDAECEELGAIGEVVSSPDYAAEGSVLIVHQPREIS
ncbi:hypothetical protein MKX01_017138 [Papaver californicum]|nr:hypothetical protein MKX01_017138 [Papaver californicum]